MQRILREFCVLLFGQILPGGISGDGISPNLYTTLSEANGSMGRIRNG